MNIREGRPSMYATESRPPAVVNDRFLQHVFSNNRPGPPPSGFTGILGYCFNYVFSFFYNTASSIITAILSIIRPTERSKIKNFFFFLILFNYFFSSKFLVVTDPLGDVLNFIRTYNEKYPEHPVFYQGTYAQALNDAKRELKFLLVYIHSDGSSDTTKFCRNSLSNRQVIDYVNRNMLFWGCDLASPEGFRVSHSISARIYPMLVIAGMRANKMIIMGRMEGDCSPEELLRRLTTVVGDNEVWLNQARSERLERSLTQSLRQQQDEAYELSLKADQEKERQKQLERNEIQRQVELIEEEKRAEERKKDDIARLKIDLASTVPNEPDNNSPDATSLVFKLPSGLRLERRFNNYDSLQDVFNYVFCHPGSPDTFEITQNFPKRVLNCNAKESEIIQTLSEAGLRNREVLFVNDLDA